MTNVLTDLRNVALKDAIDVRNISENILLSLTQEIAMDISELPTILENHGISTEQYEALARMPRFLALLRAQCIAWGKADNAETRVKLKSQAMVEQALPDLFQELVKPGLTTAKVELVKTLMKAGSLGAEQRDGSAGEQVVIQINMGEVQEKHVKPASVIDATPVIDYGAEDA